MPGRTALLLLAVVALASCSAPSITRDEAVAAFKTALQYQQGIDMPRDMAKAAGFLRQAADFGLAEAQFNLGNLYHAGSGVTLDYRSAAEWFRKAAEQGLPQAQYNLANAYRLGEGVEQNYARAAQWYRNAADSGFAAAQFNLGAMYGNGEGVPQDYADAYYWLLLARKQGYAEAGKYLENFRPDLSAKARADIERRVEEAHAAVTARLKALSGSGAATVP